jgi:TIR domain
MYRVFLSHSRRDNAAAQALFRWLTLAEPSLKGEIFLDVNPQTGFAPGVRWKSELARAVDRCEAVICLISPHWEASGECVAEARLAESLNKRVFCARIDPAAQGDRVREWQICDLFTDGRGEEITVASDEGEPVVFSAEGLARLLRGLREAGIGAEYFPWPPEDDQNRAPYRGWQSMEDADAAVFFGRDAQILRGLDALRGMRTTGVERLFVILGPSGAGKSSFLRAGLRDRPHRRYSSVFELRRHSEILRLTESAALVAACPTPSMMPPSPSRMPRISGSSDWSKPSL